jgi:hypothetical protein
MNASANQPLEPTETSSCRGSILKGASRIPSCLRGSVDRSAQGFTRRHSAIRCRHESPAAHHRVVRSLCVVLADRIAGIDGGSDRLAFVIAAAADRRMCGVDPGAAAGGVAVASLVFWAIADDQAHRHEDLAEPGT